MESIGNKIVTNVFWKFAERMLAQLVSFVVSIVLARLLMPDDYGSISMVIVFITLADAFVTNGIPAALIQKKDADEIDFSSVLFFNIFFSIAIYGILYATAPSIALFYNKNELCSIIRVMGLRIIIASINSVQHAYVARNMMFKKYFWSTLFGTVISGVVGIALAFYGFGVWALVAQYMINTIIDTLVLFVTVEWKPIKVFSINRVVKLFKFGWKLLFEGVSNTIAVQLQNLIIGKEYTSSDLAYYTKGQQFPALVVNNISTAIAAVLFPAMSNEQDDTKKVLQLLRQSVKISSYVVYPMLIGMLVTASPLVKILLTEKWINTVPYLQAFCIINIPTVGLIPRHQAINSIGRSDVFMNEHIVARIIAIVILLLTYKISVIAIVIGSIFSTVILVLIVGFTSKKYNNYAYIDQIKDIAPTIVGCVIMGVPVYCVQLIGFGDSITLGMQIVLGVIIYYLYSRLCQLEEYQICKTLITSYIKHS